MKKRKLDAIINIVLVTAIVAAINIAGSFIFFRADFTANKMYTISESTKNILKKLEKPLAIKFFVSDELPPKVQPVKNDIKDLLSEYESFSDKIKVTTLVPEKDKNIEDDARRAGIQKINLNVITRDKEEVQSVYMGLALYYGDKTEIIPVAMNVKDFEYELTKKILKLTKDKKDKIVFLNKNQALPPMADPKMQEQLAAQMGSHSIYRDTTIAAEILSEQYDVSEIELKNGEKLPEDTKILVLHETDSLTDYEKFAIDQFLIKGGNLVILQNGIKFSQSFFGQERVLNWSEMLSSYGLKIKNNMVMDLYNYPAMIPDGEMQYIAPFPFFIKVGALQIDKNLPDFIKETGATGFVFSSSIEIEPKDGIEYKVIASSSGKSWEQIGTVIASPEAYKNIDENQFKKFNLAVLAKGKFNSFFKQETIPADADKTSFIEKGVKDSSIFIIGSPDFILDRTIKMFNTNVLFFANMIDFITNNNELSHIRNREQGYQFINPELSENTKNILKWFGIIFAPALAVIYGIFRMIVRNRLSGRK